MELRTPFRGQGVKKIGKVSEKQGIGVKKLGKKIE
jgi:hypothetical protein